MKSNEVGSLSAFTDMDKPLWSWSMQSGGYIFLRQGENRIRLDPDEMVQLLLGHSNDYVLDEALAHLDESNARARESVARANRAVTEYRKAARR